VTTGNWSQAALNFIDLASDSNPQTSTLYRNLNFTQKTNFIEFAAYIVIMLKYGAVYCPDYVLFYLDRKYDLTKLYSDQEVLLQMSLSR
jgi:hypothetical protein